ncbi:MAG TPA: F0F1 ATP synthase subunit B [Acidimicrobiia bacterium]|nr:F0F1 ATP synthase subunit B [Acidimicrobiia bacterium]
MQLLTALAVLAAEEGGETGGGLSLIVPPTSELIAGIIAFLIVFWFVGRRAMPMINRTLEARQQAITGQLTEAEEAKREAESLLADYRGQLAEAKNEANRIIEEARVAGEQLKADIVARAEEEAAATLSKAREEAQTEKGRALADARREVGEISVSLAEKIVGGSLDDKIQKDLIERYLTELESL